MTVALAAGSCCKKNTTGNDRLGPLPLAGFQWGQSLSANETILSEKGFRRGPETSEGAVHFIWYPPEVAPGDLPGANPYEITLFTRDDRVVAARYIRRDVPETLETFESELRAGNDLKVAWEGPPKTTTTPAGNRIAEETRILENAEFIVKNSRTRNRGTEEKVAAGLNDELEAQIYPRAQNEGISADRLKPEAAGAADPK